MGPATPRDRAAHVTLHCAITLGGTTRPVPPTAAADPTTKDALFASPLPPPPNQSRAPTNKEILRDLATTSDPHKRPHARLPPVESRGAFILPFRYTNPPPQDSHTTAALRSARSPHHRPITTPRTRPLSATAFASSAPSNIPQAPGDRRIPVVVAHPVHGAGPPATPSRPQTLSTIPDLNPAPLLAPNTTPNSPNDPHATTQPSHTFRAEVLTSGGGHGARRSTSDTCALLQGMRIRETTQTQTRTTSSRGGYEER
uniref:Uncharacterized protein n=1 Tax=Physcomitrium patens TaxID=3218 RepID=A0A2K1K690_PHYPA|nr:hypothetical protein PHYPA_011187 [Physcomitrium patens]